MLINNNKGSNSTKQSDYTMIYLQERNKIDKVTISGGARLRYVGENLVISELGGDRTGTIIIEVDQRAEVINNINTDC